MKGKKLLAGALSAAMVLSTMSFTAFADTVNYNVSETASLSTTETDNSVAKIGDTAYTSLESALAAAQADETITLVADVTITARFVNKDVPMVIDLNQKTLNINANNSDCLFRKTKFENGKIKVSGKSSTAVFYAWNDGDYLVFDNVQIDATGMSGYALIADDWSNTNGNIELINGTTITYYTTSNEKLSNVIALNGTGELKIENAKLDVKNVSNIINTNGGDVKILGTSQITGSDLSTSGIYAGKGSVSIDNTANVEISNVAINNDWNPTGAGIVLGEQTPYTKADTATVNATVHKKVTENNVANKVNVKFVPTAEANVYDIVVVPTDNTEVINRLSAAEFDFELRTDDDMNFVVAGAENVNVTRDNNDHILFNFDGVTEADASGVEVKLGTVTINGYGSFAFGIKANGNNKVQTAEVNNNIVYTVDSENLTVNGIEGNIEVPTKELTINIDFPNAVTDNVKEYQDMKVTVVGGTVNEVYNLGNNSEAMVDGKYIITTNLPENTPYIVEVYGAGYRTARYTVTMNADKTLNFWNNVKDNATVVETGNEAIKKNVTFLAGELVNDGKINIYDLSAVVSYFGTTNNVNAESQYAKYDLNRDGKIDSKDIAYVLVSWGK